MKIDGGQGGFTVIETMIVLAVTAALFAAVALTIAGRENETAFQQSINNITSSIQQAIDQVAAGDYANTNNFACDAASGVVDISSAPSNQQGSNNGCIFLGKALQFGVATNPAEYKTYTLAGLQDNQGALSNAKPVAIDRCSTPLASACAASSFPDASTTGSLYNGLTVTCMKYFTTPTPPAVPAGPCGVGVGTGIGAFAIVSSLGNYDSANSDYTSGSQQQSIIPIDTTSLNQTSPNAVSAINAKLPGAGGLASPASVVAICFASGGTNQSGLVTIGGGSRALSVTLTIKGSGDCS